MRKWDERMCGWSAVGVKATTGTEQIHRRVDVLSRGWGLIKTSLEASAGLVRGRETAFSKTFHSRLSVRRRGAVSRHSPNAILDQRVIGAQEIHRRQLGWRWLRLQTAARLNRRTSTLPFVSIRTIARPAAPCCRHRTVLTVRDAPHVAAYTGQLLQNAPQDPPGGVAPRSSV